MDIINPLHYRQGKETIEKIRESLTELEFIGYLKGSIIKYKDRAGLKVYVDNCPKKSYIADMQKAEWYENKLVESENRRLT